MFLLCSSLRYSAGRDSDMTSQRILAWPLAGGLLLAAGTPNPPPDSQFAFEQLASEAVAGPVSAVVERVIDGDTLDVRARIWLGQTLTVRVRIEGIDAPEARSACADERRLAAAARDFLARRLLNKEIALMHVVYDKFGGRVRADISDSQGSVAQALLAAGLARPYRGERRQISAWSRRPSYRRSVGRPLAAGCWRSLPELSPPPSACRLCRISA